MNKKLTILVLICLTVSLGNLTAQERLFSARDAVILSRLTRSPSDSGFMRDVAIKGVNMFSSLHHLPRTGDRIVKSTVFYLDAGLSGYNQIWDFSRLKLNGEVYAIDYLSTPVSSLTGMDHQMMQLFTVSDDTLLISGYESPLTLISFEKPEEVMVFPTSYGDERINYFYGKGKYCDRLEMDIAGVTYRVADGYGNLLFPGNDTLYNVLRVYSAKITLTDSRPMTVGFDIRSGRDVPLTYQDVLHRLAQDTAYTVSETYRWYCKGARYPVLETGTSQQVVNGKIVSSSKNTYVFHPEDQQLDLPDDFANLSAKEEERNVFLDGNREPGDEFNLNVYPNPVINELRIDIQSEHPGNGGLYIYNLQGQIVYHRRFQIQSGIHRETVGMQSFERGNYILLIRVGEKSERKVIVKQ